MHLFDHSGRIKRYESAEQVLTEFFHLRVEYYDKRKVCVIFSCVCLCARMFMFVRCRRCY